jgi:hypothetical protein
MSASDPSRHAFEAAIIAFKNGLENEGTFNALLDNKTNINMVWDAISDIQEKQHSQGRLRNMAKIDAFLRRMEAYGSVIDTFVSAKADILALIWGPIRLLIVWTENATRLADAVMGAMAKIGDALPQSMDIINIFSDNEKLKQLLALFFRDILDFYVIALRLSSLSSELIFSHGCDSFRNSNSLGTAAH